MWAEQLWSKLVQFMLFFIQTSHSVFNTTIGRNQNSEMFRSYKKMALCSEYCWENELSSRRVIIQTSPRCKTIREQHQRRKKEKMNLSICCLSTHHANWSVSECCIIIKGLLEYYY